MIRITNLAPVFRNSLVVMATAMSTTASADFIGDSKAVLEMRNFYMNRDFRQQGGMENQEDWGQAFTLRLQSGFTEGPVGFGLDAIGQLGVKLDGAKGRSSNNGVFAVDSDGTPRDEISELGLTAKFKVSDTTLHLGTLQPFLPVLLYNDTRLLSGTFSGGMLTSKEIDGLALNAGRVTKANLRNSSNNQDIAYYKGQTSDHFDFAGGRYEVNPELALTYFYADLDDIYRQHYLALMHQWPLAEGVRLTSDLRYFDSRSHGAEKAGKIDNSNANGMLTLGVGAHKFGVAYQHISGDGEFPFPLGSDPWVVNLSTYNLFNRPEQRSWQTRYDFDFARVGIPGLSFMTRYIKGYNVNEGNVRDGKEWERDTDLAYTVQSGTFKGLNLRLRNVTFRSSAGLTTDVDETRIIVGYSLPLW